MTTFAFIGFGEAGGLLAKGLIASGADVVATYDILIDDPAKARAHVDKAEGLGVKAARTPKEAVLGADIVISAVVSSQSPAAAASVAPHLAPGQTFFDINSTSPMVKQQNAALIEKSGAAYIDSAVMDLVPPHGHKVPMFIAGKTAKKIEPILNGYGMRVEAISEAVGTASTIKMVRSVFLKGFSAILLESLVAAGKVGAQEQVLDSLQVTFPQIDWRQMADYYAVRLVKHARRQASEMHEVADTLVHLGMEPFTTLGTAKRLEWLSDLRLDERSEPAPDSYQALIRAVHK